MRKRVRCIKWVMIVLFLALCAYIGTLMLGTEKMAVSSVGSRSRTMELYTLKGTIYDRNLQPITNGQQRYYLLIDPRSFPSGQVDYVARLCGEDADVLRGKLQRESAFILVSSQKPNAMAGVYVFEGVKRYGGVADHLVGYINSELQGVAGIEKSYSNTLSYFGGEKRLVFSADGRSNPLVGLGLTVEGDDGNYRDGVVTTLDLGAQKLLENAMDQHIEKGAAVVLDIHSGEIRALVSRPDFDADHIEQYLQSENGELVNRALRAQTVGSVFKVVVAAAALEKGLGDYVCSCNGSVRVDGREFTCPVEDGHGEQTLQQAFASSCNVYFISLGQMLGTETVMEMAKRLGFGASMEIAENLYASGGMLPDVTGNGAKQLANISIGQGDLMASPLQIARLLAVCGNGGYLLSPTCFQGFYIRQKFQSEQWLEYSTRVIDEKVAEGLRQLCVATVNEGTGKAACPTGSSAGGKTSSAQTGVFDEKKGVEVLNTYFAGFFPAEDPQYAIAVFAENGKSGGATCAPVFKALCEGMLAAEKEGKKD